MPLRESAHALALALQEELPSPEAAQFGRGRGLSRMKTREREHTKISIPQLLQFPAAEEGDMVSLVIGPVVVTSGNAFSSISSSLLEATANQDQVGLDAPSAADQAGTPMIRALWTISILTMAAVLSSALYQPAAGVLFGRSHLAYYATLAGIFFAGFAEALTARWLSRSTRDAKWQQRFGRAVLCGSVVPFVAILGIGSRRFTKG